MLRNQGSPRLRGYARWTVWDLTTRLVMGCAFVFGGCIPPGGGGEFLGDDCPAEPDTDGDGIGDACDSPDVAVFSFVTGDDTLRLNVDERLRPLEFLTSEASARMIWSNDLTSVEITIQSGGYTWTLEGDADFSDAAALAAIGDVETETGLDLTVLSDWIVAHPGLVEATARGEQEAAQPPADVSTAVISKSRPVYQSNVDPNVRRHLDMIANASTKAINTAFNLFRLLRQVEREGPAELVPVLRGLVNHFVELRDQLLRYLQEQQDACVACLPACLVRCGLLETGACCYFEGGESRCEDNITQDDCLARNDGIFSAGLGCGAGGTDVCLRACCVSTEAPGIGIISCCEDLLPETCDLIEANGTNVTTVHDRSRRCGDPEFFCPVCP